MRGGAAVLGAGSWGTALAIHLARGGVPTRLWARRPEMAADLNKARENLLYLPAARFPEELEVTAEIGAALRGATLVLFVVPAQHSRGVFRAAVPVLEADCDLVIASKGIEPESLLRLSEVLALELQGRPAGRTISVLSGPSFAAEMVRGDPTALVAAGDDESTRRLQGMLSTGGVRVYRNGDRVGVELAGALKNIIALAAGIVEGIGFGSNTRAALITRGASEISRLGTALGGRASTFAGLAGMGDLILTCTGGLSRNRAVGAAIGSGRRLEEVLGEMRMVAEGVPTTRAAVALSERHRIEMPIARQVFEVLFEGRPAREAVADLLSRPLKEEA